MSSQAHSIVGKAVREGLLPKLDGSINCVDCGKPARDYDHRDYAKPLQVEPVCRTCNLRRGMAANHPDEEAIQKRKASRTAARSPLPKERCERLKSNRLALRISLRDLSKASGISLTSLYEIETGDGFMATLAMAEKALRIEAKRVLIAAASILADEEIA